MGAWNHRGKTSLAPAQTGPTRLKTTGGFDSVTQKTTLSAILLVLLLGLCYCKGSGYAADDGYVSIYGTWLYPIWEKSARYDLSDHYGGGVALKDENWRLDATFLTEKQSVKGESDYSAYRAGLSLYILLEDGGPQPNYYYGSGVGVWRSKLRKESRTELAVEGITGLKFNRFEVFTRLIYWPDSRNIRVGSLISLGITF